jgi:multisubunit Na+/H+ antiporter MnhG subunit
LTDLVEKKKNYKDAEGHVIIPPRNFLTSPMKKGMIGKNVYLGGLPEYKPDEYDRKRLLERKEREEHHKKL